MKTKITYWLGVLVMAFVAPFTVAQGTDVTAESADSWTCEPPASHAQQDVVLVEMIYDNPPNKVPARVSYTKFGTLVSDSLWSCQNEAGWCEDKARKFVKEKFADVGWTCTGTSKAESEGQ